jgi:hypothetical protein
LRDAMPGPARRAGRCAAAFLAAALTLSAAGASGAGPGQPTSLMPEAGVRPRIGAPLPEPAPAVPRTAMPSPAPPPLIVPDRTAGRTIQPLFYQQGGSAKAGLTGRVFDPAGAGP